MTRQNVSRCLSAAVCVLSVTAILLVTNAARAQQQRPSSFSPVIEEPFDVVRARDKAAKPRVMAAHQRLLEERYDLSRRVDESVSMTRGKPIPVGPTAKLKAGITWEQLGRMTSPKRSGSSEAVSLSATAARESSGRRHGLSAG